MKEDTNIFDESGKDVSSQRHAKEMFRISIKYASQTKDSESSYII